MKNNQSKKVALVTGASSGFGKRIALDLLSEGYTVYGAARRVNMMKDIEEKGGYSLSMDVTNDESIAKGLNQIIEKDGTIDVLINNAGYAAYGNMENINMDDVIKQFNVNVFGLGKITQHVLPYMRKQRSGRIINMSSVVGKISGSMLGWYAASKHAVEAVSDALRIETKPFGIKVSIIEPGSVKTEFDDVALNQLDQIDYPEDYQPNLDRFRKMIVDGYASAPGPEVVSKAVLKAVKSRRPRRRYIITTMAKTAIFMRKWFGDRLLDRML